MVHPTDDLTAYALGALEPDEARRVRSHLARCGECRREVATHEDTLWRVAEAGPFLEPPGGLRERIVAAHRRRPLIRTFRDWMAHPVPLIAPAVLVVVLAAALAGLVASRQEADAYARALADIPGARVTALTGEDPERRGALVRPRDGDPYLLLRLPAPGPGEVWEAWILRAGRAVPAGISEGRGVFTLVLTETLSAGDQVAVTSEPRPGSDRPTRPPILVTAELDGAIELGTAFVARVLGRQRRAASG